MATNNQKENVPVGVINPYKNVEVIQHKKYISHLGFGFVDLKTIERRPFKSSRTILRTISGVFNYGTFNAILGAKQSGKTTLLKTMVGRNNENVMPESQFFINQDKPPLAVYFDREIEANILLTLTVCELLEYGFRVRNLRVPIHERTAIIKDLIKNFELTEIREEQLLQCTPEERIRAEIAMALATRNRPNLLVMDEPLHNIDAVGIEDLVMLLKRITRTYSIAITFSVGQVLDSDILAVFDKLYVLSRGGMCIYEGSVEHLSLFLRESDVIISSKIQTPIERLMKIASKPNQVTLRLAKVTGSTRDEILHTSQKYGVEALNGVETTMDKISVGNILDLFSRSFLHLYRYYWRSIVTFYVILIFGTILLTATFGSQIGVPSGCYDWNGNTTVAARFVITGDKAQVDPSIIDNMLADDNIIVIEHQNLIDQNVKFMFVITISLTFFQVISSVKGLNEEVRVAINEHRNGWISIVSYFVVKNILDLVIPVLNTVSVGSLAFWLTNQVPHAWRFFSFLYALCILVVASQSLGFVFGIIAVFNRRFTNAMIIVSCILLVIFSGYLIPLVGFHGWVDAISYISFVKEAYEIILLSLYGLDRCQEMGHEHSYVLDEYGIDDENGFLRNSLIILVHIVVCRLAFLQIIVNKVNKQQYVKRPVVSPAESDDHDAEYDVDRY